MAANLFTRDDTSNFSRGPFTVDPDFDYLHTSSSVQGMPVSYPTTSSQLRALISPSSALGQFTIPAPRPIFIAPSTPSDADRFVSQDPFRYLQPDTLQYLAQMSPVQLERLLPTPVPPLTLHDFHGRLHHSTVHDPASLLTSTALRNGLDRNPFMGFHPPGFSDDACDEASLHANYLQFEPSHTHNQTPDADSPPYNEVLVPSNTAPAPVDMYVQWQSSEESSPVPPNSAVAEVSMDTSTSELDALQQVIDTFLESHGNNVPWPRPCAWQARRDAAFYALTPCAQAVLIRLVAAVQKESHGAKIDSNHIPRVTNCFMAFRKWVGELRKALNLPARNGRHLSIIASSLWKYTGEDVQAVFREVAKFSEERHQELHQDYKYRPGSRGDARQAKKEEKRSSKRIKGRRGESRQPEPPSQFQILFGEYITAT